MGTEIQYNDHGWHDGESSIHHTLHVPEYDNPTSFGLNGAAGYMLQISSMLAVGTLDTEERPWTTLLGGEPGFARSFGTNVVGVKAIVGRKHDPVIETLLNTESKGRALSALGIHLDSRNRVKLSGRFLGGGLIDPTDSSENNLSNEGGDAAELQMAFAIERSLTNCPKYLNRKSLILTIPKPVLASESVPLCEAAVGLLAKADLFFMSSSHHTANMGTNHRGGPPGFVRLASNTKERTTLVYPEYSGNRLYQTLGNLSITPKAGLVIPDFDTGDVLYITGTTEIAYGDEAARILPRSNLLLKIHVTAARYVQHGLSFRAHPGEPSPYNPPVRYLTSEQHSTTTSDPSQPTDKSSIVHATLTARTILTPTIARFRFRVTTPPTAERSHWKAGQYVAFSFEDELSLGYSHSRDDDPQSLNDDYVRTFTVSSAPPSSPTGKEKELDFEITIRNVGKVTSFLFRYPIRSGLEVPLRGFGGSFGIDIPEVKGMESKRTNIPFVAGGIGITPLIAQLPELEERKLLHQDEGLKLFWAVHVRDMGLAIDTLERFPGLKGVTRVFVSGTESAKKGSRVAAEEKKTLERIKSMIDGAGGLLVERRLGKEDLLVPELGLEEVDTWYLCAGKPLRKQVVEWMEGRKVVFEDFDY